MPSQPKYIRHKNIIRSKGEDTRYGSINAAKRASREIQKGQQGTGILLVMAKMPPKETLSDA